MRNQTLLDSYLSEPHSDLTYEGIREADDGDEIAESSEHPPVADKINLLTAAVRFRPLPGRERSVPAGEQTATDEADISDASEDPSNQARSASELSEPPQLPHREIEMKPDDKTNQDTFGSTDEQSQGSNNKYLGMAPISASVHVDDIEHLIEENLSSAIDEAVRAALRNILMRRAKSELSSMAKLNKTSST